MTNQPSEFCDFVSKIRADVDTLLQSPKNRVVTEARTIELYAQLGEFRQRDRWAFASPFRGHPTLIANGRFIERRGPNDESSVSLPITLKILMITNTHFYYEIDRPLPKRDNAVSYVAEIHFIAVGSPLTEDSRGA